MAGMFFVYVNTVFPNVLMMADKKIGQFVPMLWSLFGFGNGFNYGTFSKIWIV